MLASSHPGLHLAKAIQRTLGEGQQIADPAMNRQRLRQVTARPVPQAAPPQRPLQRRVGHQEVAQRLAIART